MTLVDQLKRDEEERLFPYDDEDGTPFVRGMTLKGNLSIGVGCNLQDGITKDESDLLLSANRIATASRLLSESYPWTDALDDVRRSALINMCFNMGLAGLLHLPHVLAGLSARQLGRGERANAGLEVGGRSGATSAHRLALQLTTGTMQ